MPGEIWDLAVPVNESDDWPARKLTGSGTLNRLLDLLSRIEASAVNDVLNLNVHMVDAPGARVTGVQVKDVNEKAGTTVSVALAVDEPSVAVIVALDWAVTVDVLTGKVAELLPPATVVEAGVVTTARLSMSDMTRPQDGAVADSVTVHWLARPPATVPGVQASDDSLIEVEGCSTTDVDFVTPPPVALSCAVLGTDTPVAVALNVAEMIPPGTVTEAGTTRSVVSLASAIAIPEDGKEVRVTVHMVEPGPVIAASAQTTDDTVFNGATVNVTDLEDAFAAAVSCAVPAAALAVTVAVTGALL